LLVVYQEYHASNEDLGLMFIALHNLQSLSIKTIDTLIALSMQTEEPTHTFAHEQGKLIFTFKIILYLQICKKYYISVHFTKTQLVVLIQPIIINYRFLFS
jgi:hypothetical protein